jgi:hypothetical protein
MCGWVGASPARQVQRRAIGVAENTQGANVRRQLHVDVPRHHHGGNASARHEMALAKRRRDHRLELIRGVPVAERDDQLVADGERGAASGNKFDMAMLTKTFDAHEAEVARCGRRVSIKTAGKTEIRDARGERAMRGPKLNRQARTHLHVPTPTTLARITRCIPSLPGGVSVTSAQRI